MSYRETRVDRQIADDHLQGHGVCSFCGAGAERETLSQYGARCGPCFTFYCTGGKPNPPMPTIEQRKAILMRLRELGQANRDPRAWARRLKAREEAGEALSKMARDAWRAALPESA